MYTKTCDKCGKKIDGHSRANVVIKFKDHVCSSIKENEMTKTKHTPLPWTTDNAGEYIHSHGGADSETGELPLLAHLYDNDFNQEANAEFIIRAVNNHDALVSVCESSIKIMELLNNEARKDGVDVEKGFKALNILKQTLAKARSEL